MKLLAFFQLSDSTRQDWIVRLKEETKSQPCKIPLTQCQEKYITLISRQIPTCFPQLRIYCIEAQRQRLSWYCWRRQASLCPVGPAMFWYNADGMKPETEHGDWALPQTKILISPRQVDFRVSKVQEGSVIAILFLCWLVNSYSYIVEHNMWGSIVRTAAPVRPLQWVHCLSCLTSSWGLINFWTALSYILGNSIPLLCVSLSSFILLRGTPSSQIWPLG